MSSRPQRVRAIELTLTPKEIVLVWLRNAMQAGSFEENSRDSLGHRGRVTNAVCDTVRNSMKGQPESLVERAIHQARREADLLYLLAVNANSAVFESSAQRNRECCFLLGYMSAEMRGNPTEDRVNHLRSAVLMFIGPVIILDGAIARVVSDHLDGQPVLFSDSAVKLAEQLKLATDLSMWFNQLAVKVGAAEIDMEKL